MTERSESHSLLSVARGWLPRATWFSIPQTELIPRITLLFGFSFLFLTLHVLDDAFVTGEPGWYGISISEFLVYLLLIFGIVPPLGLYLARRGSRWGFGILLLYALQAFYGAGLNHIRHLMGDFRGSQVLPTLLQWLDIQIGDTRGHGILSLLAGMAGLTGVPPHSHSLASTLVVFVSVGVNLVLIGPLALALVGKRE